MKKKYLALFLACFMTFPVFLSSCGSISDAIVREDKDEDDEEEDKDDDKDDDDEEEEDKDDDKDDDDEEEEDEPVYIESIDEDDLFDLLAVIIDNRDDWLVSDDPSAAIDKIGYCVTDLDHNGRPELISIVRSDYDGSTEVHIYEVDEKGKGLDEAKWKYKGLEETSDKYPDFDPDYPIWNYYDKKENETHYLIDNFFDNGNGEFGNAYIDLKYVDGKVTCWTYAAYITSDDYDYIFDDGTEVDNDTDFIKHLRDYPKRKNETESYFGIFTKNYSDMDMFEEMDEDAWEEILYASYLVFSGEMEFLTFDETYNPVVTTVTAEDKYDLIAGDWKLYSGEIDGDVSYYDEKSDQTMTLTFYDDKYVDLIEYYKGDVSFEMFEVVECNDYGDYYFAYDDEEGMPSGVDYQIYLITDVDEQYLTLYLDYYSHNDGWLAGFTLTFTRA